MIGQLEASVVRILDATGAVAGAGFLVSDRHVLTCAHVVARALGLTDSGTNMPDAEAILDFPLAARGTTLTARAILWRPSGSAASPPPDGADDLAVLELGTDPPLSSRPCRLVTAADLWGHAFRAFGFPPLRDDGVWATGVLRGRQAAGWVHIEDVKEAGYRIQPGFSGAPVWDETLDGVAGMVVAADGQPDVRAAFMIPTDALVSAWPPLRTQAIPPCPYRGLFVFREEDASVFYGRDAVSEALAEAVEQEPLVALLGASGSGKSSVVLAGLVPLLRRQGTWAIASFRPGARPFHALAAGLIAVLETQMSETDRMLEVGKLARALQQGNLTLADVVQRVLDKTGATRLLLVADQFEELYTLTEVPEDQTPFLNLLLASSQLRELCAVVTLRADFLSHALSHRRFADALQGADRMLGPMNRQELRQVVEGPARALGVEIEEGLTTRILDAVGDEPGNLPLLEFALTMLWDRQERGLLTHAGYEATGGVKGALTGHAEAVYRRMSDEDKQRAQRILVQLVRPGDGVQDTRRVAVREEVGDEGWGLVTRLASSRLVVTGRQEQTGAQTVEIVHEALITGWERLRGWMQTDRAFRLWQERLRSALRQWKSTGRDDGALLRGAPLAEATGWRTSRGHDLSPAEAEFVQASVSAAEEAEREREAIRQRELAQAQALADEQRQRAEQQARYAKLRGRQVIALTLAFVLVAGLAGFAWYERGRSDRLRLVSIQQALTLQVPRLLARKQDDLAALLARQAYNFSQEIRERRVAGTDDALRATLAVPHFSRVLRGHADGVLSLAFCPDDKTLASGSMDETVRLWDPARTGVVRSVLRGHSGSVQSVAVSPDCRTLASGESDGKVRLWNLTDPRSVRAVLNDQDNEIDSVAISPDGKTLVSAGWDGIVRLRDLAHPEATPLQLTSHGTTVRAVAFSPDGRTLVTGDDDGIVWLWGPAHPGPPRTVLGESVVLGSIYAVAFSPDGRTLATGDDDGTVALWDLAHSDTPVMLQGHKGTVRSVAFSHDGKTLASAGDDKVVRLWDLAHPDTPVMLEGHEKPVSSIVFSPDGRTLASASADETIRLWDLVPPTATPITFRANDGKDLVSPDADPIPIQGGDNGILVVAFSPDSKMVASGSSANGEVLPRPTPAPQTLRLWDLVHPGSAPVVFKASEGSVLSLAFSPDGRRLASASSDNPLTASDIGDSQLNTLRLWDVAHPDAAPTELIRQAADFDAVAFSRDGRLLASGSSDKTIKLWDLRHPRAVPTVLRGHEGPVTSVAFSPDGSTLASGSWDNTVRLWDVRRPHARPTRLRGHGKGSEAGVLSVAFSPDGKSLASANVDKTVQLWDVAHLARNPGVLTGHEGRVTSVAFSPDSKTLVSGSLDGTMRLWDLSHLDAVATVLDTRQGEISGVSFSPDSTMLASAGKNNIILVLRTTSALATMACEKSHRNLSQREWTEFVGAGIPYRRTCPNLPRVQGARE